jgi:hypothetical protein
LDAQTATNAALEELNRSVSRLTATESQLLHRAGQDTKTEEALHGYIEVCKENITGNLAWR